MSTSVLIMRIQPRTFVTYFGFFLFPLSCCWLFCLEKKYLWSNICFLCFPLICCNSLSGGGGAYLSHCVVPIVVGGFRRLARKNLKHKDAILLRRNNSSSITIIGLWQCYVTNSGSSKWGMLLIYYFCTVEMCNSSGLDIIDSMKRWVYHLHDE